MENQVNESTSVARTRVVDAEQMTVTAQLVTRKNKGAKGIVCNWTLDFTSVSTGELMELASRAVIIGEQAVMREHSKPEELAKQEIFVRDFLDRERQKAGPPTAAKAENLISKLSTVERAKIYKKMAEEMNVEVPAWVTEALGEEG